MIPSPSARSVLPGLPAALACLERPSAAPAVGWLDGLRLDSHFQPIFSPVSYTHLTLPTILLV